MTFGEKVKLIRNTRNMSQEEFAQSLGITRSHLSRLERNVYSPSQTLLILICCLYGVDMDWLINENNSETSQVFGKADSLVMQAATKFAQLPPTYQRAINAMVKELLESNDHQ